MIFAIEIKENILLILFNDRPRYYEKYMILLKEISEEIVKNYKKIIPHYQHCETFIALTGGKS